MTTDPRDGKPSASGFGDDVACPGRRNLLATIPPEELAQVRVADDPDAERGNKIHRSWQTGDTTELAEDELVDYTSGIRHIDDVISSWMRDYNLSQMAELPREERLWLHDDNLIPCLSGQVDRWYRSGKYLLIIDGKSGWTTYVPPSHRSWQLRCYAVLGWQNLDDIEHVRVAYVKPKLKSDPTDYTDYDTAALQNSRQSILYYAWFIQDPAAPIYPGIQCRYCLAKTHCPQAGAFSMLPSVIAANATTPRDIAAAVAKLTPADLVKIWSVSTVVSNIQEAGKARLKAMPPEELERLGLKLGKPKRLDPITNTKGAFDLLKTSIPEDSLFMALKFSKPELVKVIRREIGMSAEGAPVYLKEQLAKFIDEKSAEPPLEFIE